MFCCTRKHLLLFAVIGIAIILVVSLLFQWQIVLGYAPLFLVALCPLLHLLGGHGNHGTDRSPSGERRKDHSSSR